MSYPEWEKKDITKAWEAVLGYKPENAKNIHSIELRDGKVVKINRVNQLRFEAKISKFGQRWIINIPKALYLQLQPFLGKNIIVTLENK